MLFDDIKKLKIYIMHASLELFFFNFIFTKDLEVALSYHYSILILLAKYMIFTEYSCKFFFQIFLVFFCFI